MYVPNAIFLFYITAASKSIFVPSPKAYLVCSFYSNRYGYVPTSPMEKEHICTCSVQTILIPCRTTILSIPAVSLIANLVCRYCSHCWNSYDIHKAQLRCCPCCYGSGSERTATSIAAIRRYNRYRGQRSAARNGRAS